MRIITAPEKSLAMPTAGVRDEASPADLGRSLAYAAALRVARFGTANEHSDWETAHHVFTFSNAVHQALKRIDVAAPDIFRASLFVPVAAIGENENERER